MEYSTLHINFIDFWKAFDSVHRSTLLKILTTCGVPQKLVTMISLFYREFQCSVIHDGLLSELFKQGGHSFSLNIYANQVIGLQIK